jgi:hypothetical protein
VSVVRLIVATRSSGPPASQSVIKEMSGSVANGTPYTYQLNRINSVVFEIFSNSCMVQYNRTVSLFNRYMFRWRSTIIRPQIKY